jgi:hypothetical protein
VSLVELGMDLGGTVNHGFVVSKHLAHLDNRDPKVLKGVAKFNDWFNTCPGSNKFGSIGFAVSAVACFLEYQSIGAPLIR